MPWIVPKNRFGEEQTEILNAVLRSQKNQWIRGFAGSGKSVVLVYAAMDALAMQPNATARIVAYTHALKDMLATGLTDELKRKIPVCTYDSFKGNPESSTFIFVDEVQDLPKDILQLLENSAQKLIVAGDEEQSIYPGRIDPPGIRGLINPEEHKLAVIYRLTEKLRDIVTTILPSARVGTARMGLAKTDVRVSRGIFDSEQEEIEWVWNTAKRYAQTGDPAVILVPKHDLVKQTISRICDFEEIHRPDFPKALMGQGGKINYDPANQHLESHGLMLRYLGNDYGTQNDAEEAPLVYLMTYHSAKGLDFETVFLPYLSDRLQIWWSSDDLARRLFYVAATRSRRNLFLTYSGGPHTYVSNMPQHLLEDIDTSLKDGDGEEDSGDVW